MDEIVVAAWNSPFVKTKLREPLKMISERWFMSPVVLGLILHLYFEGYSRECPAVGFCRCLVEIIDKRQYPLSHRLQRNKTTPIQQPSPQNAKPYLHLIQPRTMFRRIYSYSCFAQLPSRIGKSGKGRRFPIFCIPTERSSAPTHRKQ